MSSFPTQFFAPTFYTPFYFPSLVTTGGGTTIGLDGPPNSDGEAFASIAAALTATREFGDVTFGTTLECRAAGADRVPAAVITPNTWAELDDVDPIELVRKVCFTLTILVRDDDPLARYAALDRLTRIAQNAIDGSDLGGGCLPDLTILRDGRFDSSSRFPEQSVILSGEFAYLILSQTGHQT